MSCQGYQFQVFCQANVHGKEKKALVEFLNGCQTLLVLTDKVGQHDCREGMHRTFGQLSTDGMTKVNRECCRDFLQMKIEIVAALNDGDPTVLLHGEAPSVDERRMLRI